MGPGVCHSLTDYVDLTDLSLVDEVTNPILADDTHRAILGNLETQVRKSYRVRKSYPARKKCFMRKSCLLGKSCLTRKSYPKDFDQISEF